MGLAASQARFLGITARKSNIEYEGQQVNQQRTALAEEVNALYSKLLALDVPVAPDTTEFYESNYSYELKGTNGYDGEYLVKSYYRNDNGTYYLNTERTYSKNVATKSVLVNSSIGTTEVDGQQVPALITTDGAFPIYSNAENSESMVTLINDTYGPNTIAEGTQLCYYQDADGLTHYMDPALVTQGNKNLSSYISDNTTVTENVVFQEASIIFDENGRFKTISAADPNTGEQIFNSTAVDTTRTYDSEGYDAALRDYTMSKDEYDKMIADLNAQTETLQQEDKVLELRLNQIDTEQNELQTELEAVKAILDKNIENTFKTFS